MHHTEKCKKQKSSILRFSCSSHPHLLAHLVDCISHFFVSSLLSLQPLQWEVTHEEGIVSRGRWQRPATQLTSGDSTVIWHSLRVAVRLARPPCTVCNPPRTHCTACLKISMQWVQYKCEGTRWSGAIEAAWPINWLYSIVGVGWGGVV